VIRVTEEEREESEERPKREMIRKIGGLALLIVGTVLLCVLFSLLYWYLVAPMGLFWITNTFIPSPPSQMHPVIDSNGTLTFYSNPSPLDLPALKVLCGGFVLILCFLVGAVIIGRIMKGGIDLWREKTSKELIKEIKELKKAIR